MTQHFFVGVDGGATKCVVRVEDEAGHVVGRAITGPANIRLSVEQTWHSIHSALEMILQNEQCVSLQAQAPVLHAGMGLAGCEVMDAYQRFIHSPHAFKTLVVSSDAHTACLGAHKGNDGAIIIAGTGVVGFQVQQASITKVGGWGFPHDDSGGGAWIGLQAIKLTLQALDNRLPSSPLAQVIYQHFNADHDHLVSWANQANSTAFAELAPMVIAAAKNGDAAASNILQRAAREIEKVATALDIALTNSDKLLPLALQGGVASSLTPYLKTNLRERLRPCQATPDEGAILLVRKYLLLNRG